MTVQMTRAEYETKYGSQPSVAAPVKMTRAEYEAKYGAMEKPMNNQPNYFERVGSVYSNTAKDVIQNVKQGASILNEAANRDRLATPTEALKGGFDIFRSVGRSIGAGAGAVFEQVAELPGIKQGLEFVTNKITEIPTVSKAIIEANELAKKYPEAAKDIESAVNIITFGTGKAAYSPLKKEIGAITQDAKQLSKIVLTPSEEAIQKNIQNLFNKSIKPSQKNLAKGDVYQNKTIEALKTIKSNVDSLSIEDSTGELITGRTPQSINELSQAIEQTKKLVFNEYDLLAKQAGKGGAVVNSKPIVNEVLKVTQNKALRVTNPEVIKYAEGWAERLKGFDNIDAETAQAIIQNLNSNLSAFYKNPTYESASKAAVDATIANYFRRSLDEAVEKATGKEYQALKNQYSALKEIENDVVKAAARDAKKNVKGLIDYTDIFTSGQMVGGILSLNPAMFAKGAAERSIKAYIKFLNDPNRAIGNIFRQLDKNPSEKFKPTSSTFNSLKDPALGLSVKDVSRVNPSALAKKMDDIDATIIDNYIQRPTLDNVMAADPILKEMGIDMLDNRVQDAILIEVMDAYGKLPLKKTIK